MTLKKLWKIVTTKLVLLTWNGKSEPSEEVREIITNSILIHKPKFQVGDVVIRKGARYLVSEVAYDYSTKTWKYLTEEYGISWRIKEDELQLVERKEDDTKS